VAIKLLFAQPAEGREGAKVFVSLFECAANVHKLKLHQDDKGAWWPELAVNFGGCADMDIQQVRVNLAARLAEIQQLLQSEEAGNIKVMTDMVSK